MSGAFPAMANMSRGDVEQMQQAMNSPGMEFEFPPEAAQRLGISPLCKPKMDTDESSPLGKPKKDPAASAAGPSKFYLRKVTEADEAEASPPRKRKKAPAGSSIDKRKATYGAETSSSEDPNEDADDSEAESPEPGSPTAPESLEREAPTAAESLETGAPPAAESSEPGSPPPALTHEEWLSRPAPPLRSTKESAGYKMESDIWDPPDWWPDHVVAIDPLNWDAWLPDGWGQGNTKITGKWKKVYVAPDGSTRSTKEQVMNYQYPQPKAKPKPKPKSCSPNWIKPKPKKTRFSDTHHAEFPWLPLSWSVAWKENSYGTRKRVYIPPNGTHFFWSKTEVQDALEAERVLEKKKAQEQKKKTKPTITPFGIDAEEQRELRRTLGEESPLMEADSPAMDDASEAMGDAVAPRAPRAPRGKSGCIELESDIDEFQDEEREAGNSGEQDGPMVIDLHTPEKGKGGRVTQQASGSASSSKPSEEAAGSKHPKPRSHHNWMRESMLKDQRRAAIQQKARAPPVFCEKRQRWTFVIPLDTPAQKTRELFHSRVEDAAGSVEIAELIIRECYQSFTLGATKDQLARYRLERQYLYARGFGEDQRMWLKFLRDQQISQAYGDAEPTKEMDKAETKGDSTSVIPVAEDDSSKPASAPAESDPSKLAIVLADDDPPKADAPSEPTAPPLEDGTAAPAEDAASEQGHPLLGDVPPKQLDVPERSLEDLIGKQAVDPLLEEVPPKQLFPWGDVTPREPAAPPLKKRIRFWHKQPDLLGVYPPYVPE